MGVGAAIGGAVAIGGARRAKKAGAEASGQAEELIGMSREQWEWGKERVGEWDELAEEFRTALNGLADEYGVFAQQIWDNWENSFGDMRQNLIDYYNNLDPAKYSSMWKANIEDQMQKEWQQLDQTMAQSGIYTSGMKQQLAKEMSMQQAEANAMADLQAPDYVMQQKNQFYGAYGAPERNQALGFQENAMNWRQNALTQGYNAQSQALQGGINFAGQAAQGYANLAQPYMQSAAGYGKKAGNLFGTGAGLIGDVIGGLF